MILPRVFSLPRLGAVPSRLSGLCISCHVISGLCLSVSCSVSECGLLDQVGPCPTQGGR